MSKVYSYSLIVYGLMGIVEFGSPWGVSGLNACYEAEALDWSRKNNRPLWLCILRRKSKIKK